MREIKFRAWDGEYMLGPESIYDFGADYFGPSIGGTYLTFDDFPDGKLPLMQYTGLKDKNGVEIYEGDIFRSRSGKVKVVEYELPSAAYLSLMGSLEYEVIGNIYENKELLDVSTSS
jgi:uncharacterized phage protein (TIGR01671 family)